MYKLEVWEDNEGWWAEGEYNFIEDAISEANLQRYNKWRVITVEAES